MEESQSFNIFTADSLGIGLFKYSLSPEEGFIIVNSALIHLLNYTSMNDFNNKKLNAFFSNQQDIDNFWGFIEKEGKVKFFETVFKDNNGGSKWVAVTALKIVLEDGKSYLEGIIEDITNHRKIEEQLSLERDSLSVLIDNIPDMVYFKDLKNRFTLVNRAHADQLNLAPVDVVGKTDLEFFPPEIAENYFSDDNYIIETGQPIVGKIEKAARSDGGVTYVSTTKLPHYDKDGKIIGTMGITRNVTDYASIEEDRIEMVINALTVLGRALEMRDPYTFSHTRHVAKIAEKIGQVLGWDERRILGIKLAGELHDLGKISIPLDILNKPGKLTDLEYRFVQQHVGKCYELIKDIKFPFSLAEIVYQHHERLDGSGYPRNLRGDEIMLEARILAVSDVLESILSYRPYREALGLEAARRELLENNGGLKYDGEIVRIVFELIEKNNGLAFWIA